MAIPHHYQLRELYNAIKNGDESQLREAIHYLDVQIHLIKLESGQCALWLASSEGKLNIVKTLIEDWTFGLLSDKTKRHLLESALSIAIEKERLDVFEFVFKVYISTNELTRYDFLINTLCDGNQISLLNVIMKHAVENIDADHSRQFVSGATREILEKSLIRGNTDILSNLDMTIVDEVEVALFSDKYATLFRDIFNKDIDELEGSLTTKETMFVLLMLPLAARIGDSHLFWFLYENLKQQDRDAELRILYYAFFSASSYNRLELTLSILDRLNHLGEVDSNRFIFNIYLDDTQIVSGVMNHLMDLICST